MPKEVRMDYEEYQELLKENEQLRNRNKELLELTDDQTHELVIKELWWYGWTVHPLYIDRKILTNIITVNKEIQEYYNNMVKKYDEEFISKKNFSYLTSKWWFKLFGGKFKV